MVVTPGASTQVAMFILSGLFKLLGLLELLLLLSLLATMPTQYSEGWCTLGTRRTLGLQHPECRNVWALAVDRQGHGTREVEGVRWRFSCGVDDDCAVKLGKESKRMN